MFSTSYLHKLFHSWRISIWLLYIGFFGFAWAALIYYCGYPEQISKNYIEKEFETVYGFDIDETPVFIILAYDKVGDEFRIRWSSVIYIAGTMSILITQYVIMTFCGLSMRKQMKEKLQNFSVIHQRLHKQFFKTLVIQITVPTILFHLPIVPVLLAPFLNSKISFQSGIIYCLFSLYPPIDGLIILSVVSEYRRALSSELDDGCTDNEDVFRVGRSFGKRISHGWRKTFITGGFEDLI